MLFHYGKANYTHLTLKGSVCKNELMTEYKASGKFLITGEYLVLHGARALALPLRKKYQTLKVETENNGKIKWYATDENDQLWMSAEFTLPLLDISTSSDLKMAKELQAILRFIQKQHPHLFDSGLNFKTAMNFSTHWGLGSSSTLISVLSQWSGVNSYLLQKTFFGGSGYDIACATSVTPLIYQLQEEKKLITPVKWEPLFKHQLYFLYLGQKQDSREAMANFKRQTPHPTKEDIYQINELTEKCLVANELVPFQKLMREHELILSKLLGIKPVKVRIFSDFEGEIKSLGGWGGDFIMVAAKEDPTRYFRDRGHHLIFKWDDLIL